eukprot:1844960-Rhodomonas_salina.1
MLCVTVHIFSRCGEKAGEEACENGRYRAAEIEVEQTGVEQTGVDRKRKRRMQRLLANLIAP